MKILLTGTTGYIGKRLLPLLLEEGHEVICCVRDKHRIPDEKPFNHPSITFLEIDFLNDSLPPLPYNDIDVAFYFESRFFGSVVIVYSYEFCIKFDHFCDIFYSQIAF